MPHLTEMIQYKLVKIELATCSAPIRTNSIACETQPQIVSHDRMQSLQHSTSLHSAGACHACLRNEVVVVLARHRGFRVRIPGSLQRSYDSDAMEHDHVAEAHAKPPHDAHHVMIGRGIELATQSLEICQEPSKLHCPARRFSPSRQVRFETISIWVRCSTLDCLTICWYKLRTSCSLSIICYRASRVARQRPCSSSIHS